MSFLRNTHKPSEFCVTESKSTRSSCVQIFASNRALNSVYSLDLVSYLDLRFLLGGFCVFIFLKQFLYFTHETQVINVMCIHTICIHVGPSSKLTHATDNVQAYQNVPKAIITMTNDNDTKNRNDYNFQQIIIDR